MKEKDSWHHCVVTKAKLLGQTYLLLALKTPTTYKFRAGQYVRIKLTDGEGDFERYYSIANAPNPDSIIEFCLGLSDERASAQLLQLKVNENLTISSADGTFKIIQANRPMVFIAGGSGISPLRAFIQELTSNFTRQPQNLVHLIYGCKDSDIFPGKEEFLELHQKYDKSFKIWLIAEESQDQNLLVGNVLSFVKDAFLQEADYYICGPRGMLQVINRRLLELGCSKEQIFYDGQELDP